MDPIITGIMGFILGWILSFIIITLFLNHIPKKKKKKKKSVHIGLLGKK